jgi:hypothetical protein
MVRYGQLLDSSKQAGAAITIVINEFTQPEADAIFKGITGQAMAMVPCVIANTSCTDAGYY